MSLKNKAVLLEKISKNTDKIGLLGLGYIGLPLALAFSEHKIKVIGYDIDVNHINSLKKEVEQGNLYKYFNPTHDETDLNDCDFYIICVPTPLNNKQEPDLSYIEKALSLIKSIMSSGSFIIIESSVYPGATQELVQKIIEGVDFKAGVDFGVATSPERIDPGNKKYNLYNIPKIIGGINSDCTEIVEALYERIIEKVVPVRDCKTAETVKLYENIFRYINICYVNEMSMLFNAIGVDTWEIISAASTKPYGFMPFFPGPSIGGSCIPINPRYLNYCLEKFNLSSKFINISDEINIEILSFSLLLIEKGLKEVNKKISNSVIAVLGLSYKKNIGDTRESPSIKIIDEIKFRGGNLKLFDPHVNKIKTESGLYFCEPSLEEALSNVDCAIFVVDHDYFKQYDSSLITAKMKNPVVIDLKNVIKKDFSMIYYGIGHVF